MVECQSIDREKLFASAADRPAMRRPISPSRATSTPGGSPVGARRLHQRHGGVAVAVDGAGHRQHVHAHLRALDRGRQLDVVDRERGEQPAQPAGIDAQALARLAVHVSRLGRHAPHAERLLHRVAGRGRGVARIREHAQGAGIWSTSGLPRIDSTSICWLRSCCQGAPRRR
jgi:hypothetical protein